MVNEKKLDIEFPKGTKGYSGMNREDNPGAEEREPASADFVASESLGVVFSPMHNQI